MAEFEELKDQVRQGRLVHTHSGCIRPGDIFVAVPGVKTDGAAYAAEAAARGASAIVAAPGAVLPEGLPCEVVRHPSPRRAVAELAAAHFHTEDLDMPMIGVTGTNGKTTITYLLEHLLLSAGMRPGILGTISYRWPGFSLDASMTTPDAWQLHELVANMAAGGVDVLAMEVSSHSLEQERAAGLPFSVGVFTNLTQDHLDYHKDMESYFQAKSRLFESLDPETGTWVVNWDDAYGCRLLERAPRAIGFGLKKDCPVRRAEVERLRGRLEQSGIRGLTMAMEFQDKSWCLESPLVGAHNASTLLAAQAAGLALGLKPRHFQALTRFTGVPGRLERVENRLGRHVFVDYAHTPDALENGLSALKPLTPGSLIAVFGCGGDRDRRKRPLMGDAVCRLADVAVLTSDNPRHEDPLAIMADAREGMAGCGRIIEEPDRKTAIHLALSMMSPADVLVVAGKGHETYQQIGDEKRPFSDQAVIREWSR